MTDNTTPDDQRFGCLFTTKQVAAIALVGAGGIEGSELEDHCEGLFDSPSDLFRTLMDMKTLGLINTVVGAVPDDPDNEPVVLFEITELGAKVVAAKLGVMQREESLRGEGGDQ